MRSRSSSLLGTPREWAVRLTASVVVGAFLGAIGPFGTYVTPLPIRLMTWTLGACLGTVLFTPAVRLARRAAGRWDVPAWFAIGVAAALVAAPYSALLGLLFTPGAWLHAGWSVRLELYGDCLLIAAPMVAASLRFPIARRDAPPTEVEAEPVVAAPIASSAGLLARLPPRLGRDLLALQMEDHYVRAHTALGSDLLLTPMIQAVAELAATEGMRVHRSWWVARSAVQGAAWEGRNLRLKLAGGLEAPVARAQVAALRAAGWLDDDGLVQRRGSTS